MDDIATIRDLQDRMKKLENELGVISGQFFKNNFTSSQVFSKDCAFTSRLKVPVYTVAPSVAEQGDLMAISGKLYVCTTASVGGTGAVWTVVGTQT